VPLLAGDPAKTSIYETKSGAKAIFEELEIPVPIGKTNIKTA
jgi:hypothetical protein